MFRNLCLFTFIFTMTLASLQAEPDARVFELRTYHAKENKLNALQSRFRDHTVSLFEKHGMTNVGYWVPTDNTGNTLVYLLSYPSKEAREASWKGFLDDPDWKTAYQASIADGKLVAKIDSLFLKETDFSSDFSKTEDPARIFEMRTYTTAEGMLPALHKRFRNHTCELFKKHGMTNLGYFELLADQENSENILIYFLAHQDADAAKKSWDLFRNDPKWRAVATASEEEAGGRILVKKGVQSLMMKATDFSLIK
ncbi:MAG: NIPSNAP family protein [Roseibacillus sp.]